MESPTPRSLLEHPAAAQRSAFHTIECVLIGGHQTDIVLHRFANRICLIITQFGVVNNVFVVRSDSVRDQQLNGGASTIDQEIVHLFGTDTDQIQSAIRYLVSSIPQLNASRDDIMITLALRSYDRDTVRQITETINQFM